MKIRSVEVSNFKSFNKMKMELAELNVIIGANASGKSNFVSIFKFLKDIFNSGLDNAIAMQGGVECIRNMNIGASENLRVKISTTSTKDAHETPNFLREIKRDGKKITCDFRLKDMTYEFELEFYKRKVGYVVGEERLDMNLDLTEVTRKNGKPQWGREIEECQINLSLDKKGKLELKHEPKDFPFSIKVIFPFMMVKKGVPKVRVKRRRKVLGLLGAPFPELAGIGGMTFFSIYSAELLMFLKQIALYDIDPKLSKRSTMITGKATLEPDGSNLAVVLKGILSTKKNRKRISSLMKDLLPFIEDLNVEKLADRSLLASTREVYCGKEYLPAPLLSDGTINLTALIIAFYFEKSPLIIVEEPERSIHPRLISKLMDMIKDVSLRGKKQTIITTHNPEVVKHVGKENLLLIHREKHFSVLHRPVENEMVKTFLENEIGIDELFVKNLLGG